MIVIVVVPAPHLQYIGSDDANTALAAKHHNLVGCARLILGNQYNVSDDRNNVMALAVYDQLHE